jgi:hypothetical protein
MGPPPAFPYRLFSLFLEPFYNTLALFLAVCFIGSFLDNLHNAVALLLTNL